MNHFAKLREAAGLSQEDLAKLTGVEQATVQRHETGKRGINRAQAIRYAKALRTTPEEIIFGGASVPVVGYVVAGAEARFPEPCNLGRAKMPKHGSDSTVAVEVWGDSLGAAFDGWMIYYDERRTPPTTDLIGQLCVVGMVNGEVKVKVLMPGRKEGHYDLVSNAGGSLETDRPVKWAARVINLMPPSIARLEDFEEPQVPKPKRKRRK